MLLGKRDILPKKSDGRSSEECGYIVKEFADPFVAPYWHVERTYDPDDARINMNIKVESTTILDQKVTFPVMINKKAISVNEVLVAYVPDEKNSGEGKEASSGICEKSSHGAAQAVQRTRSLP